jgi:hypothetical protein
MTKSLSLISRTGDISMNKKSVILPLLLVFLFAGQPYAQADNSTGALPMNATNESISANETATTVDGAPSLNYIWSFSGIETGSITMALNQEGSDLFGQAKYEPEGGKAWNAEVVGSIEGDQVSITMTAQKENEMVTTRMTGVYADDAINGNFTQISGGQRVGSGVFSAMWINPDTSSYTPAVVEETKAESAASAAVAPSEQAPSNNNTETKSRFVDVREYKDKIGPGGDLSGIPPGMGGAGGSGW